ncbi:alpha/beta fold hydrolase [Saccharopolyspora rhizosphaerae]|uniref:Alpha/beta fold hydrolase n=1 Tax=Saccharopolyspora rhizosphaerae TaxID=2492662 RepID=A0A426K5E4_9PSEU|nr:alpha/beta fold hydrolase [Saccharopolyspora rhizosphaerae]RRO20632.1 alpha/beta fold hydrolase [Saccharopolyspora rhizosphaerae]
MPAVQERTRAADGTELAFQVGGRGRSLVLLAGQDNNHHWWDGVREDFEHAHRTITLDYRGTGASGKPDEPCSTAGFADDVIAVLDALGIDSADVYGTSMGGRTAQWLAINHPARVRRLVLGCTSPGGPHAVERDAAVRRALAQPDRRAAEQALLELMYSPAWLAEHHGPRTVLGDPDMPPHARRHHLAASNDHDAWGRLADLRARTLVLHGADDRMTPPENADLLASRIPDARAHVLPGLRHAYFHAGRPAASRLVAEFLTG